MKKTQVHIILFIIIYCVSCKQNRFDVNINNIPLKISYFDWTTEMSECKRNQEIKQLNNKFRLKLNDFYEFYLESILKTGKSNSKGVENRLNLFLKDRYIKQLNNEIINKNNIISNKKSITNSFKRLKYHLPKAKMPEAIIFWNSLFTNSVLSSDKFIGIGSERYIENSILYDSLPNPPHYNYLKEKYNSKYLQSDIAKSWIKENILPKLNKKTFLDEMIYYGKMMYITQSMLPFQGDDEILRIKKNEANWFRSNERNIWKYLVKKNIIYSIDPNHIREFFNVAPFTNGLSKKSPGQAGVFMGWRIVKSFMDENKNYTIKDLISETNNLKILKAYKING